MRYFTKAVICAAIVLFPVLARAQELAGVVRDASGAVLPGVTVEAASPVLIEKVRTTVTDGSGQYRLTDLRPGAYVVTFTLPGFTTVKREGVEVRGSGVITISADMRVGGVQETITVTGETPVVDVQTSTRRQTVIDDAVVESLPASRGYGNLLATVPGIQATGLDSGANPVMNFFTARGGRGNEGTVQISGMNVGSAFNGGGVAGYGYDTANAQEIQITISGGLGETERGGPQFNMVPREGGNSFSGSFFFSNAGKWSQGDNLDDELRAFGINEVPAIIKNWDTNFAMGGPIVRDRLWFFGNVRSFGSHNDLAGLYGNVVAGDPTRWDYVLDPNLKSRSANDKKIAGIRLTGQASERNKLSFYYDYQKNCTGSSYAKGGEQCRDRGDDWIAVGGFGALSPESGNVWDDREKIMQATWSSPMTNRLLLEAGFSQFVSNWGGQTPAGALDTDPFIPVTELSAAINPATGQRYVPVPFFTYHGFSGQGNNYQSHNVWRGSASYVTGAHSMKAGYQAGYLVTNLFGNFPAHGLSYLFLNGNPIQFTMRITPWQDGQRTRYDAFYVQDQWTTGRLTLQGALRYEHAWSFFPEGLSGLLAPSRFMPTPFTYEKHDGVSYHDIVPRMGAAYDVFGNGKTSLKLNFSKYLQAANNEGLYAIPNKSSTFAETTNRAWVDNGNRVPDCDLMNPVAQDTRATGGDLCGAWSNLAFGNVNNITRVDPDVLSGWGVRNYDWQFGVSVQQEILPRVSAEVSYNRRTWGNHFVTDNQAVGPQDFDAFTITSPSHPDLNTSGDQLTYVTIKPDKFGQVNNYYTSASNFGDPKFWWHGVDVTGNARMTNGLTFQGGVSTGSGHQDRCDLLAALPELLGGDQVASCKVDEVWQSSFRGLVSYTVPKIDVLVSGIIRSQANAQPTTNDSRLGSNGASLAANYTVTTAQVQAALGRPLAGNAATTTVDLTQPGQIYGPRVNAVDMRFAKILRFGTTRTNVGLDLYNLLNANTGTAFNQSFGTDGATWLRPTAILNPRFVRFNVTVDF
jgi:hypothetical protein